jgi:hypothetical protein
VILAVAMLYTSPLADAEVVAARPAKVAKAGAPQAELEATIRTTFVDTSPTPASCKEQVSVSVQLTALVNGPEIWKLPTSKLKLPLLLQQR